MAVYAAGQIVTDAELNTGSAQVDMTSITVAVTALSGASKLWDIPPNAATGGSSWRLTVVGKFVLGTTAVGNSWYIGYGPGATSTAEIVIASSSNYVASDTLHWTVIIHMVVNVGGSSGSASIFGTMAAGDNASSEITWTNGVTAAAFDTTADNKLCFLYGWSAITGSPILTSYFSIFERMS